MTQKEIAAALRCCSRNFLSGCCDCKMYDEVNCICMRNRYIKDCWEAKHGTTDI